MRKLLETIGEAQYDQAMKKHCFLSQIPAYIFTDGICMLNHMVTKMELSVSAYFYSDSGHIVDKLNNQNL